MQTENLAPVSVIIPCYNCMLTVERAVLSVARQSWRPAEVILIDDASTDKTYQVLQALKTRFEADWIQVLCHRDNRGPGAARNTGWNRARQPYVAFLDADNAWHPEKIEIQMAYMLQYPEVVIAGHQWRWIRQGGKILDDFDPPEHYRVVSLSSWKLLISNPLYTSTVIVQSDIPFEFEASKRYSEDYLLWALILLNGYKGVVIDLPLAYLYKPPYGVGGLSGHLWNMERGEIDTYWQLYRKRMIPPLPLLGLILFSFAKHVRRVIKSRLWRLIQ